MPDITEYERALRVEIAAIRRIVGALEKLDRAAQLRTLRYLADRYETAAARDVMTEIDNSVGAAPGT